MKVSNCKIANSPFFKKNYRTIRKTAAIPIKTVMGALAIRNLKKNNLKNTSYYHLYCISDDKKYLRYLKISQNKTLERIRRKIRSGGKVKIAFQTSFLSTWIGDELIELLENDSRFDVTAVPVWQTNSSKEEIPPLIEHFKEMGVKCSFADGTIHPGDFDIVVYTSPYLFALDNWNAKDIPLSTLVCHIPYGIYIAKLQQMQFNQFIHGINWRNYSTSKFFFNLADQYCRIHQYGMVYSGYSKMDKAFDLHCGASAVWKSVGDSAEVKKIIYAPHHSIDSEPYYATFDKNKDFILQYAKDHIETTSWLYKPHPLLRINAVKSGLFKSEEEYDSYVNEWRKLPNAVVAEGEYIPYMASSDAMILDSVSFLAEYLYFHKPLLFLTRHGEGMNEFGCLLKETLYQSSGADFDKIRSFLEKTIYEDPMKEKRDRFFSMYLDYYEENKKLAADFIYTDFIDNFCT
jgi:hypothetical protein